MSPYRPAFGYQPPLFPAKEEDIAVQAHLWRCHHVWSTACAALLRSSSWIQESVDRHCPLATSYQPGMKVWLLAKDLPIQVESKKLNLRNSSDLMRLTKSFNPSMVRLKLPPALKVHSHFPPESQCLRVLSTLTPILLLPTRSLMRPAGNFLFFNFVIPFFCSFEFIFHFCVKSTSHLTFHSQHSTETAFLSHQWSHLLLNLMQPSTPSVGPYNFWNHTNM